MARSVAGVVAQMVACGMPELDPIELQVNTGRVMRYGPKKRAWYRVWETPGRNGRSYYAGAFGCFGRIDTQHIEPDDADIDQEERERIRALARVAAERETEKRARLAQRAADNAHDTWGRAAVDGESSYLQRKKISPLAGGWVRYLGNMVVVPMVRYDQAADRRLKGVQLIHPDGVKRFTSGMDKIGTAAVLGLHEAGKPILVCEGLATAASVWWAIERRLRVVVAFDAGNLQWVGQIFSDLDRAARLLFCADDDFLTEGNPGRSKANQAARLFGGGVVFPLFRKRGDRKLTDFNDLHVTEGLAEVSAQVNSALRWLPRL